ncbi:photosystem I chlorophyll a/b-binding protein 5, chloroplastic [Tanacetum coccineum]|uniref:Chlorophyll a-b binding protein, chloroplastic n=1 Tax=Tanacetum coccineum TaxID=301880 RepID=A0ABQ5I6S7_9ASTR
MAAVIMMASVRIPVQNTVLRQIFEIDGIWEWLWNETMAYTVVVMVIELLRVTGLSDLPVWFVETKRYMDFTNPGSQAKQGSFFGLEAALEGLEPSPLLNPLGLANDIENAHEWKLKEIKNGRLAIVAMLGSTKLSLL